MIIIIITGTVRHGSLLYILVQYVNIYKINMQEIRKNKLNLYNMYLVLFQNTLAWKRLDVITEIVLNI